VELPFLEAARHPLFRPEMGLDDALGASAVESASRGVARFAGALLAGEEAWSATAEDVRPSNSCSLVFR
jgi:hypothetical protein